MPQTHLQVESLKSLLATQFKTEHDCSANKHTFNKRYAYLLCLHCFLFSKVSATVLFHGQLNVTKTLRVLVQTHVLVKKHRSRLSTQFAIENNCSIDFRAESCRYSSGPCADSLQIWGGYDS